MELQRIVVHIPPVGSSLFLLAAGSLLAGASPRYLLHGIGWRAHNSVFNVLRIFPLSRGNATQWNSETLGTRESRLLVEVPVEVI